MRSKEYEAWYSSPARAMERSHFSGVDRFCRRNTKDGACGAHRRRRLSSTCRLIEPCGSTVRGARRFVCALSDPDSYSYCARVTFHDAGAIAVQFNHSGQLSPEAPLEWPHFCCLRRCDRDLGAGDELWHARYRRLQSGGGVDTVRHVLSILAVQGGLA